MSPVGQLLRSILVPFLGGRELMSPPPCFDEMRMPDGAARPAYARLARWLEELPPERLRFIGNGALVGARLALLSRPLRRRGAQLAQRAEHLQLAGTPDFQTRFTEALLFT